FKDAAIREGSFHLNTPFLRSSALLCLVTYPDQRLPALARRLPAVARLVLEACFDVPGFFAIWRQPTSSPCVPLTPMLPAQAGSHSRNDAARPKKLIPC